MYFPQFLFLKKMENIQTYKYKDKNYKLSDFQEGVGDGWEEYRTALKDEDEEVQRNALVAMYNLIGRDILDEVISLPGYSKFLKEEAQSMIEEYEEGEEDE